MALAQRTMVACRALPGRASAICCQDTLVPFFSRDLIDRNMLCPVDSIQRLSVSGKVSSHER